MEKKTDINKKLGARIKYLRQQKGLSQEGLAEKIDIATTSLSYIETGRGFMTLQTLEKLSKVLDVEMFEIFQFYTLTDTKEMYDFILKKINYFKNDDEKIKVIYNFFINVL